MRVYSVQLHVARRTAHLNPLPLPRGEASQDPARDKSRRYRSESVAKTVRSAVRGVFLRCRRPAFASFDVAGGWQFQFR